MPDAAQQIADDVLFPHAQRVDRSCIPDSHFEAIADAGLFSIADRSLADARRSVAALAGGCGATFFVWAQHHGVLRALALSSNQALRDEWGGDLRAGRAIGGTAFAHVRRQGPAAVAASRTRDGWRLDGFAPWATSWGIAACFTVAALTDDGRVVWAMIPGRDPAGVTAIPLELSVFSATGTVALRFEGCQIHDDDVVSIEEIDTWRVADRRRASVGQPAVLGVGERSIRLIEEHASSKEAVDAAQRLRGELAGLWADDDRLSAGLAAGDDLVLPASDHRAACLAFGQRAATALLGSVGGVGMNLDHPAQRLAREATFYVIQAQTVDGRAAMLRSV